MDGQKSWYESTSIWGSLVAAICLVLNYFFGVTVDADTQKVLINHLVSGVSTIGALAGIAGAIWGRIRANKQIAVKAS